jgi:hypothetical protein
MSEPVSLRQARILRIMGDSTHRLSDLDVAMTWATSTLV